MPVTTALAVVPSSDLSASRTWWTQVLGREPDQIPMPSDIEWYFTGGGGLQLIDDSAHAGAGTVTLLVDDVDAELTALTKRGLDVPEAQTVPSGQFRIAMLADPAGNTVVLARALTQ